MNEGKRILNLIVWVTLGLFSLFYVPASVVIFLDDPKISRVGWIVFAVIVAYLALLNFKRWSRKVNVELETSEFMNNQTVIIPGLLIYRNTESHEIVYEKTLIEFNSQSKVILLNTETKNMNIAWSSVREIFIKNGGLKGGGREAYIVTNERTYLFEIARSKEASDAATTAGVISLAFGGAVGTLSLSKYIMQHRDLSVVYPYFDLNKLYYWLKLKRPPFKINKLAPAAFGVIFMLAIMVGGFITALIFESVARNFTDINSAARYGGIGFALPLTIVVVSVILKNRSFRKKL